MRLLPVEDEARIAERLTDRLCAAGYGSNTVEVFIARLRRKLARSAIETIRGIGYRVGADR
jgi:DNA-binding response OmpR family regulator